MYDFSKEELQELLDNSESYGDLLRKLEMSDSGGNRITLRKVINDYDLDLSKINENRSKKNALLIRKNTNNKRRNIEELLVENSKCKSNYLLKRLIKDGVKEYKCEECGIIEWMGKPIKLQLHHKNGKHYDNRLKNIKILCPNCHSQTDNFAGKGASKIPKLSKEQEKKKAYYGISDDGNRFYDGYGNYKIKCPICKNNFMKKEAEMCIACFKKKRLKPPVSKEILCETLKDNSYTSASKVLNVNRKTLSKWHKYYLLEGDNLDDIKINSDKAPSREILKTDIRTMPFIHIGKKYGVSNNAIKKWCITYNLPTSHRVAKNMSDEMWSKI